MGTRAQVDQITALVGGDASKGGDLAHDKGDLEGVVVEQGQGLLLAEDQTSEDLGLGDDLLGGSLDGLVVSLFEDLLKSEP